MNGVGASPEQSAILLGMTATVPPRELTGDKARSIVAAMRASVAARGVESSTFDIVAREAGVSRGLLHYYFGTKEELLAEVVRSDCADRMAILDAALAPCRTADEVLDALVASLEEALETDPAFMAGIFELFTVARRNERSAREMAALWARTREHVGALLARKADEGVLVLGAAPDAVATVLFALADGFSFRMLSEPEYDAREALAAGVAAARVLLRAP